MPTADRPVPLSASSLAELTVQTPTYDRDGLRPAIVHIGVGGFHRAHLATYVHELCMSGNRDWAISGSGILASDARMNTVLHDQDFLYTLIIRGTDDVDTCVIGSIIDYTLAADDPSVLIDKIASPETQVVSLTVTEGGYPIDDSTGRYLASSPVAGPGSAFAIIAAGLEKRRMAGGHPLTVLSCDNIVTNGAATKTSTLGAAMSYGAELLSWIESSVSFPNSMVDRITPATADSDRTWLLETHGIDDGWPVVTEPFRQWVIEDDFAGDRPPLEDLDVIITKDVEPYEHMKLRLLNAGHSCLAYLAALRDHETVDAAMADPVLRRFVRHFLSVEAQPMVPSVEGIDLDAYVDSLIERFSNPQIGDQISRLCLDGSAKFPKFLIPTVRAQLATGGPVEASALALAGWCQYLLGSSENGTPLTRSADPQLDIATELANRSIDEPGAFLGLSEVFDADVAQSDRFRQSFCSALTAIRADGINPTIELLVQDNDRSTS